MNHAKGIHINLNPPTPIRNACSSTSELTLNSSNKTKHMHYMRSLYLLTSQKKRESYHSLVEAGCQSVRPPCYTEADSCHVVQSSVSPLPSFLSSKNLHCSSTEADQGRSYSLSCPPRRGVRGQSNINTTPLVFTKRVFLYGIIYIKLI